MLYSLFTSICFILFFFFSSRRRHTRCALVTEFRRVLFRLLLLAQQVAGTADVGVVAGELEAGTEAVQRLHHVQALLRRRAEDTPRRQREVGIAALLGTADAAAERVKLRQADHVGTVENHGVGGRDEIGGARGWERGGQYGEI